MRNNPLNIKTRIRFLKEKMVILENNTELSVEETVRALLKIESKIHRLKSLLPKVTFESNTNFRHTKRGNEVTEYIYKILEDFRNQHQNQPDDFRILSIDEIIDAALETGIAYTQTEIGGMDFDVFIEEVLKIMDEDKERRAQQQTLAFHLPALFSPAGTPRTMPQTGVETLESDTDEHLPELPNHTSNRAAASTLTSNYAQYGRFFTSPPPEDLNQNTDNQNQRSRRSGL